MNRGAGTWLMALAALGVAGATALALTAAGSTPFAVDSDILRALRVDGDPATPIGSAHMAGMVRDLTALGSVIALTLFTAIAVLFLAVQRRWTAALTVLCVIGGGQIVSTLVKIMVGRARPDIVTHLALEVSPSFPSGHAMMSMIAYVTFAALIGWSIKSQAARIFLVLAAVALSLAIGLSRLYVGVHWPTDVLAGWCLGLAWLAIWGLVVLARR